MNDKEQYRVMSPKQHMRYLSIFLISGLMFLVGPVSCLWSTIDHLTWQLKTGVVIQTLLFGLMVFQMWRIQKEQRRSKSIIQMQIDTLANLRRVYDSRIAELEKLFPKTPA